MTVLIRITEVYHRYALPYDLQLHMLRVAAVAREIQDHWRGISLDKDMLTRVLLLHDIGNIVKMEIDAPKKAWSEHSDVNAFERVQRQMRERFGMDDHLASAGIAKELGFAPAELALLNAKIFVKNDLTAASNDYTLKVAAYADQRVAPSGVMPLLDRLNEAKERYKDRPGSSMNNPKTDYLIECAVEIEDQLKQFCAIHLNNITNVSTAPYINALREYKLLCHS